MSLTRKTKSNLFALLYVYFEFGIVIQSIGEVFFCLFSYFYLKFEAHCQLGLGEQ
jgi:hypothetical protein